jgi:glycogen phosphorylase
MKVTTYTVDPNIPEPLAPLRELASNLWLSWNYDAVRLFMRLDYDLWMESRQNPARLIGMVSQERYEQLATDDSYLAALRDVHEKFVRYRNGETWFGKSGTDVIAYFSMEYGLDVSLPIYAGGLGVLSGDHVKTSSDLGLPLVGVGLLYRQGYFQQYLNADGYQQESYPENDWYNMPVSICRDDSGAPVKVSVQIGGASVVAQIWKVEIGRSALYLLDSNIDENSDENRAITAQLYAGTRETRIKQEILLGIGGIRALRALGINPSVTHMNEGHSAFLAMERIRMLMTEHKLSLSAAIETLRQTNIFTTHTPVPAGNERFSVELVQKYFHDIVDGIDIDWLEFLALGRERPDDETEDFCMTVLALKLSSYNNAVSELHGEVSRKMWTGIWPGLPEKEVPISSITNGVHVRNWLSHEMLDLLDRYFGPRFYDDPTHLEIWDRMDRISDEELWRTHERRKERLVAFAREKLRGHLEHRGVTGNQLALADEVLSPYALTISFARRFATYKRATLLFRDKERLIRLLTNPDMPVQLIFSGKAHPHDVPGKNLIKEIIHESSRPELRSRIVFLENYDISTAKYLVSGSDMWLNTPRRPMEASGTSGMKAAINGVLNCSILDGWWAEGYDPSLGWAIGSGESYEDEEEQDEIESKLLYDLLEREIIPLYFDRGRDGLPRGWIEKMKSCMRELGPRFDSHRMLMEYTDSFYRPAIASALQLRESSYEGATTKANHLAKIRAGWGAVEVVRAPSIGDMPLSVGMKMPVEAAVKLGKLTPDDVAVEAYSGAMSSTGEIDDGQATEMSCREKPSGDGVYTFRTEVGCNRAGRQGLAIRIVPRHDGKPLYATGLLVWG